MSASALFQAFDRRIRTTKADEDVALERLVSCTTALARHYYPSHAQAGHLTIIGSLIKGTGTVPMSDVDGVFHLPAGTHERYTRYLGNGQSALLQEVRGILTGRYPRTSIRGDGPVVVVEFTSGPNVEIVPGAFFNPGADIAHADCRVPVTRGGGSWETANYGIEYDQLAVLNAATQGQYTRLIRYMKQWRRAWGATLPSIVLERMAAAFMQTWNRTHTGYSFNDWLVRDFLAYMILNRYSSYALPSGKIIGVGAGWIDQAKTAHASASAACGWGDANPLYVTYWKKVFGSAFGT